MMSVWRRSHQRGTFSKVTNFWLVTRGSHKFSRYERSHIRQLIWTSHFIWVFFFCINEILFKFSSSSANRRRSYCNRRSQWCAAYVVRCCFTSWSVAQEQKRKFPASCSFTNAGRYIVEYAKHQSWITGLFVELKRHFKHSTQLM